MTADTSFQAFPHDLRADRATREAPRYREALPVGSHELSSGPLGAATAETMPGQWHRGDRERDARESLRGTYVNGTLAHHAGTRSGAGTGPSA